jgi:hypothetical protein
MTNNVLAFPDGAESAEVLLHEDGSTVMRWGGGDAGDLWIVTLSSDGRTVDVALSHNYRVVPELPDVLETLSVVLRYHSGVNINLRFEPQQPFAA